MQQPETKSILDIPDETEELAKAIVEQYGPRTLSGYEAARFIRSFYAERRKH